VKAKSILAIIPARGGSKGYRGKNIRPLMGLPLIAHSIRCAEMCPEISRCIISTDSDQIAKVARTFRGRCSFFAPSRMAQDDTPMIPVLQQAIREVERLESRRYESLLLLDPTSPGRLPSDVTQAVGRNVGRGSKVCWCRLASRNPLQPSLEFVSRSETAMLHSRLPAALNIPAVQDVPPVFRINATLYLWRRDYLIDAPVAPFASGAPHRLLIVPEDRAIHIR